MLFPEFNTSNENDLWERYRELLWYDKSLGFWIDISRMKINSGDIKKLEPSLEKAIESMELLESGHISNIDENRQVGHYWLRNPDLAPTKNISDSISNEIDLIEKFGSDINNDIIQSPSNNNFTDVLWIGIGGSSLGPLLLHESLKNDSSKIRFHFIDNVDPVGISESLEYLKNNITTTLFVVVSKSGGTPEPRIAMEQSRDFLERNGGSWPEQAVAITMKDSLLDKKAKKELWLKTFDLPDWVGGRTSITSSVGLLICSLLGINIRDFLSGAKEMDILTREKNLLQNPAILLAISWFIAGYGKGSRDMVVLPYKDRLSLLSKYLQQLIMESLGKKVNRSGEIVNQGISVYGNKGSTDQHAYVQQLRDGLDNFFLTFIEILEDTNIKNISNINEPGDYLVGFLYGTRSALTEGGKQNLTITINNFSEKSLGALIALFERTVGIYAELIDINAYHQPGVEAGKIAASELLNLQSNIESLLTKETPLTINNIQKSLDLKSPENIYLILRHLVHSRDYISYTGDWSDPYKMTFILNEKKSDDKIY